ncbi:MAG: methyltransferase, TIGR04325 family [Sphingobacteriales bacterium]|nr:MAG: methyltransferase, TIGR04325 family [Sphingobacteriales bacterium]
MGALNYLVKNLKVVIRKYSPSPYGWKGDYPGWAEARKDCAGYDAQNILEKVQTATSAVLEGKAAYERDSVLFENYDYSFPLLSYLLFAHELQENKLNIIDFGGSLGSSFLQHRKFLERLPGIKWNIIEQPNFVEAGKKLFTGSVLDFHGSIEECISKQGKQDLILISSTLPYLEDPYSLLKMILTFDIRFLVIDHTPFNYEDRDRITVQRVDPVIYEASYPCRFLSLRKVKALLYEKYNIISDHYNEATIYLDGRPVRYQGIFLELKTSK